MSTLSFWFMYFSPTLIAWYRVRHGKPIVLPLRTLFLFNLTLGWTVVAWLLSLANALGFNPVASVAQGLVKVLPAGGSGAGPGPVDPGSSGTQSKVCPACDAQGRAPCTACNGGGQRYEGAGLVACSACQGSRTVFCQQWQRAGARLAQVGFASAARPGNEKPALGAGASFFLGSQ